MRDRLASGYIAAGVSEYLKIECPRRLLEWARKVLLLVHFCEYNNCSIGPSVCCFDLSAVHQADGSTANMADEILDAMLSPHGAYASNETSKPACRVQIKGKSSHACLSLQTGLEIGLHDLRYAFK